MHQFKFHSIVSDSSDDGLDAPVQFQPNSELAKFVYYAIRILERLKDELQDQLGQLDELRKIFVQNVGSH